MPAPNPVPAPAAQTLLIENLALVLRVGVGEAERSRPQRLLVTLRAAVTPGRPLRDEVAEVVDYGVIAAGIRALAGQEVRLLETLAGTIAAIAFADPRVEAVEIELRKPDLFQDCQVGIAARYRRPGAPPPGD
jgi:dihydroneopterin aldolase